MAFNDSDQSACYNLHPNHKRTPRPLQREWNLSITELSSRIAGRILQPGAAEYEATRQIWKVMIDRRPAAIVRCAESSDIAPAIAWVRGGNRHRGRADASSQ